MAAVCEKFVKKTLKVVAEANGLDYEKLKKDSKKVIKSAQNYDQSLLGLMESLLDLGDVSSEEELADFDIEVLKVYCKIKELDASGSDKTIRKIVWAHIEAELELDTDTEDESDQESVTENEEPLVIKKAK